MRSQCTSLALQIMRRARYSHGNNSSIITASIKRHLADVSTKHPIDDLTTDQLNKPIEDVQPVTGQALSPSPSTTSAPELNDKEALIAKAQIVFGSRLAGPAERRAELDRSSTLIAGTLVPPKPEEPDNCCMGGCVNCVWDRYRDELEEWAMKNTEAQSKLAAQRRQQSESLNAAMSMDDDGGGSETNWPAPSAGAGQDLFEGVPVGIREFMRTEKKLKERQRAAAAAG